MVWHKRYSDGSAKKNPNNLLIYYYNNFGDYIMVLNVEGRKRPLGYRFTFSGKDKTGLKYNLTESTNLASLKKLCERCRNSR